jgi:hypothetical protein
MYRNVKNHVLVKEKNDAVYCLSQISASCTPLTPVARVQRRSWVCFAISSIVHVPAGMPARQISMLIAWSTMTVRMALVSAQLSPIRRAAGLPTHVIVAPTKGGTGILWAGLLRNILMSLRWYKSWIRRPAHTSRWRDRSRRYRRWDGVNIAVRRRERWPISLSWVRCTWGYPGTRHVSVKSFRLIYSDKGPMFVLNKPGGCQRRTTIQRLGFHICRTCGRCRLLRRVRNV